PPSSGAVPRRTGREFRPAAGDLFRKSCKRSASGGRKWAEEGDKGREPMSARHADGVLRHLHGMVLRDAAGLTHGQLLESLLARREEAAFEALVRRHGPMVLGVCRRLLGNAHDADDAFQATFLVLARKAASVRPRELLPNWLHGVAYHAALKLRATNARRPARERQVTAIPVPHHIP